MAFTGMATTTRSPASAACPAVAAVASGPSSATSSRSVSGPRELLITTVYPAATLSRATVPPISPLPMKPIVVMTPPTPGRPRSFLGFFPASFPGPQRAGHGFGDFGVVQPEPAGEPGDLPRDLAGRQPGDQRGGRVQRGELAIEEFEPAFERRHRVIDDQVGEGHAGVEPPGQCPVAVLAPESGR